MKIEGKIAVVTGAASGLGLGTLEVLVERGARVAIFDMNEEAGKRLEAQYGDRVKLYVTDVTCEATVTDNLRALAEHWGAPHINVNCAGFGVSKKIFSSRGGVHDLEHFQNTLNANLVGTFNVMRLATALFAENAPDPETGERGVIINTASTAYRDGQAGQVAYSASKGGIVAMTLPVARDLGSLGVRINVIAPGVFATPPMLAAPQAFRENLAQQVQFPKRLGAPGEFGLMVAQIIENPYLNGEVIHLDGALRM